MRSPLRAFSLTLPALAAAALLAAAPAEAGPPQRPTKPSLTGTAQLLRPDGEDVRFT